MAVRSGYDVLRLVMALLLLTAAGLKCHELATQPIIGKTWLDSRWLLMAAVEFELAFGLWLLFGNCSWSPLPPGEGKGEGRLPRLTWAAALATFSLFTLVSLYKALSGYVTCGCFGRVAVNPWFTTALDFTIVLCLLRWRSMLPSPSGRGAEGEGAISMSPLPLGEGQGEGASRIPPFILQHSAFTVCCLWLLLGVPAAYAMGSYTSATLTEGGLIVGDGDLVTLEPQAWVSRRFPLLPYIDDFPKSVKREQPTLVQAICQARQTWS
jgi:hypothetical protein